MKRVFAALLLMLLAATAITPHQLPAKLQTAIDTRDHAAAVVELQNLRSEDEKIFEAANYDYLLARMAESNGEISVAVANYQAVAGRDSILRPYALKHLSQIARSTGNLTYESILLREIVVTFPGSLPASGAGFRLATNRLESGDSLATIRLLNGGLTELSGTSARLRVKDTSSREKDALLAEAHMRAGHADQARSLFDRLADDPPTPGQPDDASLKAARGLDLLDSSNLQGPGISDAEHAKRANIYQANREFQSAKLHYDAVLANYSDRNVAADAVFQIGRGFVQRSDFAEGLKWFERVLEQFADSPAAKDALLQAASAYGRVGKPREATLRYQQFIEKYPSDDKAERAYLNIVDIFRDHGEDFEALKWCRKTREAFPGRVPEAVAIFAEARINIAREDWGAALENLVSLKGHSDLGGAAVPGGTTPAEVDFLRALALEQLKRFPEAIDHYLSITDGRGEYYGGRATERLRQMSGNETSRAFVSQKVGHLFSGLRSKDPDLTRRNAQAILRLTDDPHLREKAINELTTALRSLPGYRDVPKLKMLDPGSQPARPGAGDGHAALGDVLFELGLFDEAAMEFDAAAGIVPDAAGDKGFTLATYYLRGDRADRAMAFIEPLWRKIPADHPIDLIPRDQLRLLYPVAYAGRLLRYAAARKVDPRLILAIIRQESRFQPDARSNAAARGLMQFIPATADRVAGELGREHAAHEDLYDPSTSILFGSQYLSDLFQVFPGQPEAVVASYNGGDDNMKRWLARSRSSLPDRYVPEIAFAQTKDYVHKVMANYRVYQYMYDEFLEPR